LLARAKISFPWTGRVTPDCAALHPGYASNGCVAEVQMDENLVKQLRTGQAATFIIFQTPEEGIGIPMSLKGFGEGFDKLP
jgi:hypothetical protein